MRRVWIVLIALCVLGADDQRLRLRRGRTAAGENPIAAARLPGGSATLPNPTWSTAGTGTIPARTTICSTLGDSGQSLSYAQPTTAANIQTALNACTADQTVLLNPGTYTLTTKITIPDDVTLRGSGPNETKLSFTGDSNCGPTGDAHVCFSGPNADMSGCCNENRSDWTAGHTIGTSSITLSANTDGSAAPQVGGMIFLDAVRDGTTDAGDLWPEVYECSGADCTVSAGGSATGHDTAFIKTHVAKVTSVSGTGPYTVGIDPPLMMPTAYWNVSGRHASWVNSSWTDNAGIEDLWIDNASSVRASSVAVEWSANIWIKNVKITNDGDGNANDNAQMTIVKIHFSTHVTVRDSYIFAGHEPRHKDTYGVGCRAAGNILIENTILQFMRAPIIYEQCDNIVAGYNYAFRQITDVAGNGWNYSGIGDNHAGGGNHLLWEGNDGLSLVMENFHGNGQFATLWRNNLTGMEMVTFVNDTEPAQTAVMKYYAYNRFGNVVGNVLGKSGYHTRYEHNADVDTGTACKFSIYSFGHGDNCTVGDGATFPNDDDRALTSALRWFNWDVVTSTDDNGTNDTTGRRCESSEVPSGLTNYANAVPGSCAAPSSIYLSSKPSFFGARSWPAIGPDVSNGEVANRGGHVNKIPARACFDAMGGAWSDSAAVAFTGWKTGACVF